MKKLLILIIVSAVYLHFYPEPKLEEWFNEQKNSILTNFNNMTDTKVRLNAQKVYTDIAPSFNQFSPEETIYTTELTSHRDKIINFYKTYCEKNKPDYNFQPANQQLVCKTIGKYTSYF